MIEEIDPRVCCAERRWRWRRRWHDIRRHSRRHQPASASRWRRAGSGGGRGEDNPAAHHREGDKSAGIVAQSAADGGPWRRGHRADRRRATPGRFNFSLGGSGGTGGDAGLDGPCLTESKPAAGSGHDVEHDVDACESPCVKQYGLSASVGGGGGTADSQARSPRSVHRRGNRLQHERQYCRRRIGGALAHGERSASRTARSDACRGVLGIFAQAFPGAAAMAVRRSTSRSCLSAREDQELQHRRDRRRAAAAARSAARGDRQWVVADA